MMIKPMSSALPAEKMGGFDVVFLLLSEGVTQRADQMLSLYWAVTGVGFHTAVATHPFELYRTAARFRIIVIDGSEQQTDFDPFAVTRDLRNRHGDKQCIVFVAGGSADAMARGREAGADLCVAGDVREFALCDALSKLAYRNRPVSALDPQALPSVSEASSRGLPAATVAGSAVDRRPRSRGRAIEIYRSRKRNKRQMSKNSKLAIRTI